MDPLASGEGEMSSIRTHPPAFLHLPNPELGHSPEVDGGGGGGSGGAATAGKQGPYVCLGGEGTNST